MTRTEDRWTGTELPDQRGKTAIVTGASSGIGFQAAFRLAGLGAAVVLACRNQAKGELAAGRISAAHPQATIRLIQLDLSSLSSVHEAAKEVVSNYRGIDLLINNAGVMWAPYELTEDGFELHLGSNHLGHFALTGLLLDKLLAAPSSRVVNVSSPSHRQGHINFDDLEYAHHYDKSAAYARSKLANLLFTYELQRRLDAAGAATAALAAHPGAARTELNRHLPRPFRGASWGLSRPMTHSAEKGVLPILRAALGPDAVGGSYFAPSGKREYKGFPVLRQSSELSRDRDLQERIWQASEALTGVRVRCPQQP